MHIYIYAVTTDKKGCELEGDHRGPYGGLGGRKGKGEI